MCLICDNSSPCFVNSFKKWLGKEEPGGGLMHKPTIVPIGGAL